MYVFSKIRLQWLDRLKLPPRSALVIESFQADKTTTRKLSLAHSLDLAHLRITSVLMLLQRFTPPGIQMSVSKSDLVRGQRARSKHSPGLAQAHRLVVVVGCHQPIHRE